MTYDATYIHKQAEARWLLLERIIDMHRNQTMLKMDNHNLMSDIITDYYLIICSILLYYTITHITY